MSNPTELVSSFDGSLAYQSPSGAGVWTPVAPTVYDDGLLLTESAINYCSNPNVASTTDWISFSSVGGNSDGARVTDQLDMGPAVWRFRVLTYAPGDSYLTGHRATTEVAGLTGQITPSVLVKANRAIALVTLQTRLYYTDTSVENTDLTGQVLPTDPTRIVFPSATINAAKTLNQARGHIIPTTGTQTGDIIWTSKGQIENKGYALPLFSGADGSGFAWTGAANASTSTRAASSASVTIAEPAAVACWYREAYSGAKTFAYLEPYGTLGTYGSIGWSGGTLTLSTTRNLVIGPFAAFDRVLTAQERANLSETQSWTRDTVGGSGRILVPLTAGRRRSR